jgi:hypothetical protein
MFYRLARSRVESIHIPILKQASEFLAEDIGDRFMGVEDAINSHHRSDARFEGGCSWRQVATERQAYQSRS